MAKSIFTDIENTIDYYTRAKGKPPEKITLTHNQFQSVAKRLTPNPKSKEGKTMLNKTLAAGSLVYKK